MNVKSLLGFMIIFGLIGFVIISVIIFNFNYWQEQKIVNKNEIVITKYFEDKNKKNMFSNNTYEFYSFLLFKNKLLYFSSLNLKSDYLGIKKDQVVEIYNKNNELLTKQNIKFNHFELNNFKTSIKDFFLFSTDFNLLNVNQYKTKNNYFNEFEVKYKGYNYIITLDKKKNFSILNKDSSKTIKIYYYGYDNIFKSLFIQPSDRTYIIESTNIDNEDLLNIFILFFYRKVQF